MAHFLHFAEGNVSILDKVKIMPISMLYEEHEQDIESVFNRSKISLNNYDNVS